MNINLINTKHNISEIIFRHSGILEITKTNDESHEISLSFYDFQRNLLKNIAPDEKKYDFIPVFNCIWGSSDVFYATYIESNEGLDIIVKKYNIETDEITHVLTFKDDNSILRMEKIVKFFVLNDKYIIIQTEKKIDIKNKSLMGNIEFVQLLYDCKSREYSPVKDLNLINNGINTIIPVSSTSIVLKTGFSHLEDKRIDSQNEDDALIESIYFVGTSMFLSSIMIENTISGAKLLGTAYFDKCILAPKSESDYIYFSTVDLSKNVLETTFFNHVSGELIKAVNEEPDLSDLDDVYIINGQPYIRNTFSDRIEFFNVKNSETDMVFFDDAFLDVVGDLILFERHAKQNTFLRIYDSIKSDLLLEEKTAYSMGCHKDDNYFIYTEQK